MYRRYYSKRWVAMQKTNTTDFRSHVAHYLAIVENGEQVVIMRHGRAIAKLTPMSTETKKPSWQQPALQLKIKGLSLSKVILDERSKS